MEGESPTLIYERFCINRLFAKVGRFGSSNTKTYSEVDTLTEDIINSNLEYCSNSKMNVIDEQKDLPIIYQLSKRTK